MSPNDKNICELISETHSDEQLKEIIQYRGDLLSLNKKYKIECIRETAYGCKVVYKGCAHYAEVWFQDNVASGGWLYKVSPPYSDFESIEVGQTLDVVQKLDPEASYLFLYSGTGEPRISRHYTKDGYLIAISYDEKDYIISIETGLI
jgi:hypothetical protein